MNSCLYNCQVMHRRTSPTRHAFKYGLFMFYIDLDELELLDREFNLVGWNRFAPFEFRDSDHYDPQNQGLKRSIVSFLEERGIAGPVGKVYLLTHLRTWGHVFNPVSFYFVEDRSGEPLCSIAEVGNTFNEQKLFIVPSSASGLATSDAPKHFYVSPFSDLDTQFHFRLRIPGQRLRISIDQSKNEQRYFRSALVGEHRQLSDWALALSSARFPFLTLKIVAAIHWQALLLYLKKAPFWKKADNPGMQTDAHPYLTKESYQRH